MPTRADLYGIVEEYTALGQHRTGTPVDWATAEWMADHLGRRGLAVELEPMTFGQWTATSTLTADGEPVDHLPVFYEFEGSVTTNAPELVALDPMSGGFPGVLDEPVAAAQERGVDALVVATEHPSGSLVAINRMPGAGSGLATVLVAGRDHTRLEAADEVALRIEANEVDGRTSTVVGQRGDGHRPLVVSTPLTGWFGCAGERATGIAVLLDLLDRLSHVPVLVVATTGHEIGQLGVERWVGNLDPAAIRGIVHLGASIAVIDDTGELAATRVAMTTVDGSVADSMTAALASARLDLVAGATSWIGEAEAFARVGTPLLSFSGAGTDFHTPEDLPHRATSPEALDTAADAVASAVTHFVASLEA
ncbi:MAG: hypothetical protein OES57_05240 [Acidimicrobiia bacterium]|nr:hypothetical protein [Acidimicrobiia bacterium]